MLQNLLSQEADVKEFNFIPVLKYIISNAEKNSSLLPKCRRHPEILKKFSTSLLIYAGPLAYEFMQQNLPQALYTMPADSIQQIVHSEYKTITEGDFRFDDLLQHIKQYRGSHGCNCWTRVIARVEYDYETDHCVGFVLPTSRTGLPLTNSFIAVSFAAVESMFSTNEISKYAYVYMVQPLGENIPLFA